ncbi:hypothetical protein V8E36_005513 [Tilletia maclaganii]
MQGEADSINDELKLLISATYSLQPCAITSPTTTDARPVSSTMARRIMTSNPATTSPSVRRSTPRRTQKTTRIAMPALLRQKNDRRRRRGRRPQLRRRTNRRVE